MQSVTYPAIGSHLRTRDTKRVLDIGAEWYTAHTKDLFGNDAICYWVIDINDRPDDLKCDSFLKTSILHLSDAHRELVSYFDVVISYGVLGALKFPKPEVGRYLEQVSTVLKPDGIFMLKLDTSFMTDWEEEFVIDLATLDSYFEPHRVGNLPPIQLVRDWQFVYTFYTLKKRRG